MAKFHDIFPEKIHVLRTYVRTYTFSYKYNSMDVSVDVLSVGLKKSVSCMISMKICGSARRTSAQHQLNTPPGFITLWALFSFDTVCLYYCAVGHAQLNIMQKLVYLR